MSEDLVVTIDLDATRFYAALREAVEASARLAVALTPFLTLFRLRGQRGRMRQVTRRKQRRSW